MRTKLRPPSRATPRLRRTPQAAREAILEAAERRLAHAGPASLRVQELASDVGMTHPTLLHHFGSRQGLVDELVRRATRQLSQEARTILSEEPRRPGQTARTEAILAAAAASFTERGTARLLAGLLLAGEDLAPLARDVLGGLPRMMHAERVKAAAEDGRPRPGLDDTRHVAALMMIVMLGDALFGAMVRAGVGLRASERAGRRFRRFVARVFESYTPTEEVDRG